MIRTHRLGAAIVLALSSGVPAVLAATVLTISHKGRLKRLFKHFARRFLDAYIEARDIPSSRRAQRRLARAKATLDLVRARIACIGEQRPTDALILEWGRSPDQIKVVASRVAA